MLGCGERDPPPPFSSRNSGFAASAARKDVRESPETFFLLAARALFSPPPPQPTVTVSGRRYKLAKKDEGKKGLSPAATLCQEKEEKGIWEMPKLPLSSLRVLKSEFTDMLGGSRVQQWIRRRPTEHSWCTFFASRYLERCSGFLVIFSPWPLKRCRRFARKNSY